MLGEKHWAAGFNLICSIIYPQDFFAQTKAVRVACDVENRCVLKILSHFFDHLWWNKRVLWSLFYKIYIFFPELCSLKTTAKTWIFIFVTCFPVDPPQNTQTFQVHQCIAIFSWFFRRRLSLARAKTIFLCVCFFPVAQINRKSFSPPIVIQSASCLGQRHSICRIAARIFDRLSCLLQVFRVIRLQARKEKK